MATIPDTSRFTNTELILEDGVETFGTWTMPSYLIERPVDDHIKKFKVTSALEGRPDLIANQVYDNPHLAWVIIAFNGTRDVLNWPRAGDTIEYPISRLVITEL